MNYEARRVVLVQPIHEERVKGDIATTFTFRKATMIVEFSKVKGNFAARSHNRSLGEASVRRDVGRYSFIDRVLDVRRNWMMLTLRNKIICIIES